VKYLNLNEKLKLNSRDNGKGGESLVHEARIGMNCKRAFEIFKKHLKQPGRS